MSDEQNEDGVNREGLDYRAGYVEGLTKLLDSLRIHAIRCKKREAAGLELAFSSAQDIRKAMIEKMKGK